MALDLLAHEALVEHSAGRGGRIPLGPDRAVGEHATYDPAEVANYFAAATQAALS